MKSKRRQFLGAMLWSAGALTLPVSAPIMAQDKNKPVDDTQTMALRGRVVCLTEELQKTYRVEPDCEKRGHAYTLKAMDGKLYPFLPTDSAAAVWMDGRYRERDLRVTVRTFLHTDFIEVIKFQSWLNGKLHNLYYFCDVCMIETHKPGPCDCCQEPVQFRETPSEN